MEETGMDETEDVPATGEVLRESGRPRAAHYLPITRRNHCSLGDCAGPGWVGSGRVGLGRAGAGQAGPGRACGRGKLGRNRTNEPFGGGCAG